MFGAKSEATEPFFSLQAIFNPIFPVHARAGASSPSVWFVPKMFKLFFSIFFSIAWRNADLQFYCLSTTHDRHVPHRKTPQSSILQMTEANCQKGQRVRLMHGSNPCEIHMSPYRGESFATMHSIFAVNSLRSLRPDQPPPSMPSQYLTVVCWLLDASSACYPPMFRENLLQPVQINRKQHKMTDHGFRSQYYNPFYVSKPLHAAVPCEKWVAVKSFGLKSFFIFIFVFFCCVVLASLG